MKLAQLVDIRLHSIGEASRVRVEFKAPARIRVADRVEASFDPFDLLKKIAERIEFLAFLHSAERQRIDYRPLLASFPFPSAENGLQSLVFEQYSSAQGRKTRREALVGAMEFDVNRDMLAMLAAGEIIGVGANTSYGFGRFVVEAV